MKHILIHLDDHDYRLLMKHKGDMTWEQFLLLGVKTVDKKTI